jgi:integrase
VVAKMVLSMARPVQRRGSSRHQFRRRVPRDVLAKARGRRIAFRFPRDDGSEEIVTVTAGTEVMFSLRTADARTARERQGLALAQFEEWCETIRRGPRPLTAKQRVALAGLLYRAFADGLEDDPGDAELWERVKAANDFAMAGPTLGIYENEEEARRDAMERRFGRLVDTILQREGIVTDEASRSDLLRQAGRALNEAAAKLGRNASGDYSPDANAARFPAWDGKTETVPTQKASGTTLTGLFERWRRETNPAPGTVVTWRGHVRQFIKHLGHDDAARVTPENIIAWKDALVARGLRGINTGHLATIKALFNYGVENKLVASNPAQGVSARQRRRAGDRQLPYSDDEVARLLALADRETNPARRWLPWLMALSGARVGEVAQLWGKRIVELDGIPVMKIAPAEDGGTLKNEGSEREVPIHPALIRRGFIDFVREVGDGPLFYGQRRARPAALRSAEGPSRRHASKGITNHLAAWIREQGFKERRKAPSHALRHWFKTACTKAGIPDIIADHIQGHTSERSVADRYRHVDLKMMSEELVKIKIPRS